MVFQLFIFFVLLGLAAWQDYKTRTIPDILTCLLWFVLMASMRMEAFVALGLAFAMLWLLNIVFLNIKKRDFWSWGDILIFPPFFAQLYLWGSPIWAILCLLIPFSIGGLRKKQEEEIIVPYLFAGAVIAFVLKTYGILGI